MEFVDFMLDDNLIPIRRDVYPERYFVRDSTGLHFYDTYKEACEAHPATKAHGSPVKSYKFIPGMMSDLPQSVLDDNAGYISTLKQSGGVIGKINKRRNIFRRCERIFKNNRRMETLTATAQKEIGL